MRVNIYGQGGEFTLGGVNEKQVQFIYEKLKNSHDDRGRKHIDDNVFETDEIPLSWNEIDDVTHIYGVSPDQFSMNSLDKNWDQDINIDTKGLGTFEIDYAKDCRLEFEKENKRVILGWNNLGAGFDKGFNTLNKRDFSEKTLEILRRGVLVGTDTIEKGHFGEVELPDDFDKSKLILVWTKFRFVEDQMNFRNKSLARIFYDGEEVEIDTVGETITKEQYHFILKSNVSDCHDTVSFDYPGYEFTSNLLC